MATEEECRQALRRLEAKLEENADQAHSKIKLDRHLSLHVTDLNISYHGRLVEGKLVDVREGAKPDAKIRLAASSDDLVALVDGQLNFARAWATGQVTVKASVFDLMKLKSLL